MNISKAFSRSGSGGMVQVTVGHGVDFVTEVPTVRVTLHKPTNTMAHLSMSPAEAREFAAVLLGNAAKVDEEIAAKAASKEARQAHADITSPDTVG